MTDGVEQPGEPGDRKKTEWRNRHGVRTTLVVAGILGGFAAVVSAIVATVQVWLEVDDSRAVSDALPSETPDPPTAPTPPAHLPSDDEQANDTCWSAGGDAVSCSGPHSIELVSADTNGECSQDGLVRHMGGDPSLDRTWVTVSSQSLGSSEACVASADREWSGKLDGALLAASSDALRECIEEQLRVDFVGCDNRHVFELMGPAIAGSPSSTCDEVVERYTGVTPSQLDSRLQVVVLPFSDGTEQCAVAITGGDRLNASLRSLGPKSIPLAPS